MSEGTGMGAVTISRRSKWGALLWVVRRGRWTLDVSVTFTGLAAGLGLHAPPLRGAYINLGPFTLSAWRPTNEWEAAA